MFLPLVCLIYYQTKPYKGAVLQCSGSNHPIILTNLEVIKFISLIVRYNPHKVNHEAVLKIFLGKMLQIAFVENCFSGKKSLFLKHSI